MHATLNGSSERAQPIQRGIAVFNEGNKGSSLCSTLQISRETSKTK